MHPAIRKFWKDAGYAIHHYYLISAPSQEWDAKIYWKIQRGIELERIIGVTLVNGKCKYYIGDNWYWEEEALKVVRWKVFL
jgi:hypothetical protein